MYWNLRTKTRQPEFVWKLAFGVLVVGMLIAWMVQPSELSGSMEDVLNAPEAPPFEEYDEYKEYNEYVGYLDQLSMSRQWVRYWWAIPKIMWLGAVPGATAVALVTGICWFVFIVQAGQPHREHGIRWWLAALAVPLGVLSIWPTLFAVDWQDIEMGISEADDLKAGLKFFIAGVGLREELCKLLMFVPLLPPIIRRRNEREALIVAACVGLGFAMEENINYILGTGDATGRFLTANFFHMSLTGIAGLALCRGIWCPRERAAEAGVVFLVAVFVHGLYDAFIVLPDLQILGLARPC
ncbi:PrsW family glutamic-type intramembrane protease [Aeoliella mucimassa]|uniref:Protease PrsW n=1 Tax=Aeoliella mucimassa TaxID=2527972 RepID=A0A518AJ22_9BACT|nr:PrsW family glutamic-type intramembrane protease [Aeoliella mucimassa]QDU54674.1 hypothetical protein Pan181_08570 [Aeoliella mucimassa]